MWVLAQLMELGPHKGCSTDWATSWDGSRSWEMKRSIARQWICRSTRKGYVRFEVLSRTGCIRFLPCVQGQQTEWNSYLSCENLFKSTKAGAENLSLSKIITGTLEVCLNCEPYLSSRVCSECGLKTSTYRMRISSKQSKAATNSRRKIRIPESCRIKDLQSLLDR